MHSVHMVLSFCAWAAVSLVTLGRIASLLFMAWRKRNLASFLWNVVAFFIVEFFVNGGWKLLKLDPVGFPLFMYTSLIAVAMVVVEFVYRFGFGEFDFE